MSLKWVLKFRSLYYIGGWWTSVTPIDKEVNGMPADLKGFT